MDSKATIWEHCLEPAAVTDVGLRRPNNQDSLAMVVASSQEKWERRGHLFMVADGMGAHAAGELASKIACDLIPLTYYKLVELNPPRAIQSAITDANRQIHRRGTNNTEFRGMGTTVVSLIILPQGAMVSHVGDSRCYRLRGTVLEQLSFDHSLVWELRAAGQIPQGDVPSFVPKNVITRSLGPNPEVQADVEGPFPIEKDDTFLLCTDGLTNPVQDEEIGQILASLPPKDAVRSLVDLAILRGGPDNISVIVVKVTGPQVARTVTDDKGDSKGKKDGSSASGESGQDGLALALWITTAILATITLGLFVSGEPVAGILCLFAAALAAAGGVLRHPRAEKIPRFEVSAPLGKGPYSNINATPEPRFTDRVANLVQELRNTAISDDWAIDWYNFNNHTKVAAEAQQAGKFAKAIRHYCKAITYTMSQLKSQRARKKTTDNSALDIL